MTKPTGAAQNPSVAPDIEAWAAPVLETPHAYLRRVTRPWHDGVEAAFARFDLQTLDGLSGFLGRQALALLSLEAALETAGVEALLPDWPQRRRSARLIEDLTRLGQRVPRSDSAPHLPSPGHVMGALYVLEGSKLGGRVLHRRVLLSPDPRVRAVDAFLGHGQRQAWPRFLATLDAMALSFGTREALRQGAEMAFASFRVAAERDVSQWGEAPTRFGLDRHAHA